MLLNNTASFVSTIILISLENGLINIFTAGVALFAQHIQKKWFNSALISGDEDADDIDRSFLCSTRPDWLKIFPCGSA